MIASEGRRVDEYLAAKLVSKEEWEKKLKEAHEERMRRIREGKVAIEEWLRW